MRKVQEAEEARKKQLKSTISSPTKGAIAPRVASPKSALSESMMQLKSRFEQKQSSGSGLSSPVPPVPPALSSPSVYSPQRSVPRVPPPQPVRVPPPQSIQKPQVPPSQSIAKSQPQPQSIQKTQPQSIQKPQPQSIQQSIQKPQPQVPPSQPSHLPTPSTPPNLPPVLPSPHHTKPLTVAPQPTSQPDQSNQPDQSDQPKEPQEQWFELPLLEEYIRRQRVRETAPCESVEHRPRSHLREERDVRVGGCGWLWRLSGRHLPRQPSHQTVSARILRRVERRGDTEEHSDDRAVRRGVRVVCWRRSEGGHNRGCVDMFKRINRCYAKG